MVTMVEINIGTIFCLLRRRPSINKYSRTLEFVTVYVFVHFFDQEFEHILLA